LGLRQNLAQFSLLVLVTAFVGGMVGLERAILPLIAEREFGLVSKSVILSFIVGLPVPFMLMWAPSWGWITVANLLLGINQGLCWSTTVIMKIDLVGPQRRGLAMGLNEFAGYFAVAITALASGYIAAAYGLRPAPFYLGIGIAVAGLFLTIFFVRETHGHARHEAKGQGGAVSVPFKEIFTLTSWRDRNLFS
jgi:MFS family permease